MLQAERQDSPLRDGKFKTWNMQNRDSRFMQILLHWRSLLVDCEYFVAQTFTSRHIAHAEENDAVQAAVSAVLQLTINWLATIISSQLLQHSLRHSLPTLMLTPRCLDTRQGKGHSHYWSSLGFSLDTLNWRRKKTWNSTTGSWQQRDFVGWHLLLGIFLFSNFNTVTVIVLRWKHHFLPRWHWTYESHLASVSLCTVL